MEDRSISLDKDNTDMMETDTDEPTTYEELHIKTDFVMENRNDQISEENMIVRGERPSIRYAAYIKSIVEGHDVDKCDDIIMSPTIKHLMTQYI